MKAYSTQRFIEYINLEFQWDIFFKVSFTSKEVTHSWILISLLVNRNLSSYLLRNLSIWTLFPLPEHIVWAQENFAALTVKHILKKNDQFGCFSPLFLSFHWFTTVHDSKSYEQGLLRVTDLSYFHEFIVSKLFMFLKQVKFWP